MATDVKQPVDETQDQILDYIRQGQDAYVKTAQSWWDAWTDLIHQATPSETMEERPYGPRAFVDRYFDAWEKSLKLQREAWHRVLDASTYAVQASEDVAEK
ncbi:MAG: hypothetical protein ACRDZO_01285 [Egibacteraceae bacterium]